MIFRTLCLFLAVFTASAAIARPNSRTMSCAQTIALVGAQGAVVLTTGRHTFDRYVAHAGFCLWPEVRRRTYVATADNPKCPLFVCRQRVYDTFD